jgi:hypothetical protein
MKCKITILFLLITLLATTVFAETNQLVIVRSEDYGDTNYLMRIEELERNGNVSKLKLTYEKMGSSVGSSMFIMRGFYEVAKSRGTEYFINLKEWDDEDGGRMYIGGFTDDDSTPANEYGEEFASTNKYGQKRNYMSVSQCNMLWGE